MPPSPPASVATSSWATTRGYESPDFDKVNFGALALGRQETFTLFYSNEDKLPTFHAPIECRKGKERWQLLEELKAPRTRPKS
jgi:hypothetical protein